MNRFNRVAASVPASFAVSTAPHASGTLASPITWGGTTQTDAGPLRPKYREEPITVTATIVDESGASLKDSSSCSSLAAGSSCAVAGR